MSACNDHGHSSSPHPHHNALAPRAATHPALTCATSRTHTHVCARVCVLPSRRDTLDADEQLLSRGGRTAARDIVQFVPLREFAAKPPFLLAKHVLAEVPQQFLGYMRAAGISPNPRPAHPSMSHVHAGSSYGGGVAPAAAVAPPTAPPAGAYPPPPSAPGAGVGYGGTV